MGKLRPGGDYHWPMVFVADPLQGLCFAEGEIRLALLSIQAPLFRSVASSAPRASCKGSTQSSACPGRPKSVLETQSGIPPRLLPARATPGTGWEKHVEEIEPDQVVGSVQVGALGRGEMLSGSFGSGSKGFRRCHFRSLSKALGILLPYSQVSGLDLSSCGLVPIISPKCTEEQ